ncbi:MAG TPA: competence protein ComEA, partial [Eggerthellaceae bacterium]|nr:competence protein ComEA [Eggerthellaceae bacterium]
MAGIAVLVVLVAVIAGRTLIDTATASDFQIVSQRSDIEQASDASASPSTSAADAAHGASGSSASGAGDASPSAAASIFVHVTGCVARPGLVELAEGSRVADAVQAAGGFSEDAQADSVNLARVVQDGEQVAVLSAAQVEAGGQAAQPEAQAAAG